MIRPPDIVGVLVGVHCTPVIHLFNLLFCSGSSLNGTQPNFATCSDIFQRLHNLAATLMVNMFRIKHDNIN